MCVFEDSVCVCILYGRVCVVTAPSLISEWVNKDWVNVKVKE